MTYKLFKIRKMEWLYWFILGIVVLVIGIVGQCVTEKAGKYTELSTLIMIGVVSGASLLWGVGTFQSRFNIAVSMGQTRDTIILSETIVAIIKYTTVILIGSLSHYIQNQIYADKINEIPMDTLLSLKNCLLFIIGITALEVLFNALFIRFQRKFFWTMWGIYMFVCIFVRRITVYIENHRHSSVAKFGDWVRRATISIHPNEWRMIGIGVFAVMLAISYFIVIRQDVKGV